MDNVTITALSQDLYRSLLEKQHQELNETIEGIFSEVAARGFSIPQGSMYSSITKACKKSLFVMATLIWGRSISGI
jgi:virulence-associated protein VapD